MISEVKFQIFESVNRYRLIGETGNETGHPQMILLTVVQGMSSNFERAFEPGGRSRPIRVVVR